MRTVEIWKDAPDIVNGIVLSDRYEVSNIGNVKTKPYVKSGRNIHGDFNYTVGETYCSLTKSHDGYLVFNVSRITEGTKVKTTCGVHRLVASAFLGAPIGDVQVNHIDGNKENNRVDNLEWVSCRDNILHSYSTGLASNSCERHPRAVMTNEQVKEARRLYNAGDISIGEVAKVFGIKYHTMWKTLRYLNYKEVL